MKSLTNNGPLFAKAFLTYAKGLAMMVATGLGVFSAFFFVVAKGESEFLALQLVGPASSFIALLLVWCIGRNDDLYPFLKVFRNLTMLFFYLFGCWQLIANSLKEYGNLVETGPIILTCLLIIGYAILHKTFENSCQGGQQMTGTKRTDDGQPGV